MLTPKQIEVLERHEWELRTRHDSLTHQLADWAYVEGQSVETREVELDSEAEDEVSLDIIPAFLEDRSKIDAALISQATLLESYMRELLVYEDSCIEALADPERADEHADRRSELEKLREELPAWEEACRLLSVQSICGPHSQELLWDMRSETDGADMHATHSNGQAISHLGFQS